MTMRFVPPLVIAAAAALSIIAAPTAEAAPSQLTCTYLGGSITQCQSPGNAQINDSPPVQYVPQYRFWGNALIFHHGGHHR
jgi:hypothetical protein